MFGHSELKLICLWLHGLPHLKPTRVVGNWKPVVYNMAGVKDRGARRSVTPLGVAQAMAEQWGVHE